MRVLMLPRYDALGASSRLRMLQFVPSLRAAGVEVEISSLLDDGYVTDLYEGSVSVWKVARAYIKRIRMLMSAGRYDVLWVEKELFPWLPAWMEQLLLPDRPALVADYDDAIFHRYDQHHSRIVRWLLGNKIDAIMRRARLVTAGNDYLAERARAAGAKNVEWLPTVVDLDRYSCSSSKPRTEAVTVGWIGSPATAGYLLSLTTALENVALCHPIRCIAIGARPDQLRGTIFQAQTWSESGEVDMLKAFDIGIMPLPDEPWERGKCGYKLIQYMACGIPVVASPVGANIDIVQPGESGELAETSDDWTQALIRLASDPHLRQRMGHAGRRRVEKIYSLQSQSGRLIEMLRTAFLRST